MNHDLAQAGWPPVLLPTDRPRRPGTAPRCSAVARAEAALPVTDTGRERDDLLLAAFAALLHRYTGQDRITVTRTDRTGRTGLVRFAVSGDSTLAALARDGVPAEGSAPVGISFAGPPAEAPEGELHLVIAADGTPEAHYEPGLFDAGTAERLLGHYRTLVADALAAPDRPTARLRLLTEAEARRVLVEWNQTGTDLPHDVCLHEAFEARAARRPDAVAVVHGTERWTYAQINAAANRLARHLRSLGVGPDIRTGLCLDRSPDLLISMLGIMKAGGAYVPLDPDYPTQRLATMVGGTSCAVMISRTDLAANLVALSEDTPLVLLDRDADALAGQPADNLGRIADPENLCYIIHTSGSTGVPKPIALRHRGVMNNIADLNTRFQVGPGDAVLALSSPSFDMSVYEFLGLTAAGGTVVVPDRRRAKDPAHWAELITAEGITVWNSAPALLGLLVDHLEQVGAPPYHKLRLALLGGDWVPVTLPDRTRVFAPELRFIVMGGATEASIHSTIYEVEATDPAWTSIPYGVPMANQRTYILDGALQPVPPGVTGELYLAGIGLARGYLDQPERTAERFIEWSYGDVVTGERLYRTGDLARFGPDGLIELLGRADFQVKINGLRVELGEIEAVLRGHPAVRQAAVVAKGGRLAAYLVPAAAEEPDAAELDTARLRTYVAELLPEYMVPAAFVVMERLPLTPNGKLDRKGLPEPELAGAEYRAPRSPEEEILVALYAEVLGRDRVGIDDDFISIGGDSVRAIQVAVRARNRGLRVTPRQILEARTVAGLAPSVGDAADGAEPAESPAPLLTVSAADVEARRRRYPGFVETWPLTPMQAGMLYESMLSDTGHAAYRMQTVYHLSGPVDAGRLRAACQAILDRYASLRVAVAPDASGNLVQIVVDGVELPWREVDLRELAEDEREAAYRRFLADDETTRFDLGTPPLLRATLVKLDAERADLVLTSHHALFDGWSEQVLADDLLRLYAAGGDGSALPPTRPFRDYLAWLGRQDREAAIQAWTRELAGVDGPTVLAPAGAMPDAFTGTDTVSVTLSPEESAALARGCARLGVTAGTMVQAAWAVLLSGLTGREDVVFGAVVSGRPSELTGVESMVGLFINTVPVRVRCVPGATLAELVSDLQERHIALLDHQHCGLTDIHQATGFAALFDTIVTLQFFPERDGGTADIEITGVDSLGGANYPVALIVETERITLQYHRGVFDAGTAADIAARFRAVLNQLATDPERPVAAVDLLLPGEQPPTAPAARAFDTGTAELFERRATEHPDVTAVVRGAESLTYGELLRRADRLAGALARDGVGPESVVGLALAPSPHLAVGMLGVLRAGAAFALLDPGFADLPKNVPELILTEADIGGPPPDAAPRTWPLPHSEQAAFVFHPPRTGHGVLFGHRALADMVLHRATAAGMRPGTRVLAASPDIGTVALESLAALCAGATVEVVPDVTAVGGWSGEVISTTAAVLADLLDRDPAAVAAETVVLSGTVAESFAARLREALPGVRLITTYGPVETLRAEAPGIGSVPVGGGPVYVLGPGLRPVPPGVIGEVYVGGVVPRGYLGDGGLTARRFVADPFGAPGSRLYRTGELARRRRDGTLELLGAAERVGGHRVVTTEVAAVLAAHPRVTRAAVVVRDDRLIAYVTGEAGAAELRDFAARRLPAAAVPTEVVKLDALPPTADGTVPPDALPDPRAVAPQTAHRAGRTPREQALCELFAEVLGVERVGIDDDFFALGGNSLKATRLIARLRRAHGLDVPISTLFRCSTIAALSRHLGDAPRKARPVLRKVTGN